MKSLVGSGDYSTNLANERAARAHLSQQHPILTPIGSTAGTIATGAALPLGVATEGASALLGDLGFSNLFGKAATAVGANGLVGSGVGGVQGASNSPDLTDIGRTAKDTAEGMGLCAVFGGAVPLAGSGFNAVRNFVANPEGAIVSRALQVVDDATLRALKRSWKTQKAVGLHSLRPKRSSRHQTAPRVSAGCND